MGSRALSFLGRHDSGHGCYPARPIITSSDTVFVNGIGAARKDDVLAVHVCKSSAHNGKIASGSSTVFINGRQAGRIADPVSCGSVVAQGSPNVFVGG